MCPQSCLGQEPRFGSKDAAFTPLQAAFSSELLSRSRLQTFYTELPGKTKTLENPSM